MDDIIRVVIDPSGATAGRRVVQRDLQAIESGAGKSTSAIDGIKKAFAGLAAYMTARSLASSFMSTVGSFETAMSGVKAVTRSTTDEFDSMKATARELGATTRFTAGEAAEGMRSLGLAGFNANEIIKATPAMLDLAAAGYMDLGTAARTAANILRTFQIDAKDASRVTDVLAVAASSSNTDITELGYAMKYVGALARESGVSLEQTAAAVGVLSDMGLQASMAGTGLRAILAELLTPSKALQSALTSLGLTYDDVNVRTVGLSKALKNLQALDPGTQMEIFGLRGGPAALSLIGAADSMDKLYEKTSRAVGAGEKMRKTMVDNLPGAVFEFSSALEELILQLGDAGVTGAFRKIIGITTGVLQVMGGMADPLNKNYLLWQRLASSVTFVSITLGAMLAIGAGVWLVGLAAKITTAVSSFFALRASILAANAAITIYSTSVATAATATAALQTLGSFAFLVNPWVLAAAAISSVIALVVVYRNEIKKLFDPFGKEKQSLEENNALLKSKIASTKSLSDELKNLSMLTNRTVDENIRLKEVMNELENIYPRISAGMEGMNFTLSGYEKSSGKIHALTLEFQRLSNIQSLTKDESERLQEVTRQLETIYPSLSNGIKGAADSLKEYTAAVDKAMRADMAKSAFNKYQMADIEVDKIKGQIESVKSSLTMTPEANFSTASNQLKDLEKSFESAKEKANNLHETYLSLRDEIMGRTKKPETVSMEAKTELIIPDDKKLIDAREKMRMDLLRIARDQERELSEIGKEGLSLQLQQENNSHQERIDSLSELGLKMAATEGLSGQERLSIWKKIGVLMEQENTGHNAKMLAINEAAVKKELERLDKETKELLDRKKQQFDALQQQAKQLTETFSPTVKFESSMEEINKLRNTMDETGKPLISTEVYNRAILDSQKQLQEGYRNLLMTSREWKNGAIVAMSDYAEAASDAAKNFYNVWSNAFNSLEDQLTEFFTKGKLDFKSFVDSIVTDINRALIRQNITAPLASFLGTAFGGSNMLFNFAGAKEKGGDIHSGKSYLVGEKGPELIVPKISATVYPADKTRSILSDFRGGMIVSNISNSEKTTTTNIFNTQNLVSNISNTRFLSNQHFGGERAIGGPVYAGYTYKVNEITNEYFTAPTNGRIEPVQNGKEKSISINRIVINNNGVQQGGNRGTEFSERQSAKRIARRILSEVNR